MLCSGGFCGGLMEMVQAGQLESRTSHSGKASAPNAAFYLVPNYLQRCYFCVRIFFALRRMFKVWRLSPSIVAAIP